jgi:valyl-tRNA synthetase
VAKETPAKCSHCGSVELEQEKDVLDTWFSSGLLPCSVFGWPRHTHDLDIFYPTQLLVTGFDILFFWVARMIMLGCHFMLDVPMQDGSERALKDAVPFREVYIHALVRDADRQKMSKTKGNVIDPIEIVSRYGTDAVRFTLAAMASPGTDIAFSEARTEGYRAFANKIWNAARFIFMNVDRAAEVGITVDPNTLVNSLGPDADAPIEARWIVSRLNNTAAEVNLALTEYRFHEAANIVYQFFWGDFCDWYLEIVKLRLDFSDPANRQAVRSALTTLLSTFEAALRLLSPFMPFLTEELWHALYDSMPPAKSIALTRYPQPLEEALDPAVEAEMATLQELIVTIRALRKDLDVQEREPVAIQVTASTEVQALVETNRAIIEKQARVSAIEFSALWNLGPANTRTTASFTIGTPYEKQIDVAVERERLRKKLEQYEKVLVNAERQLGNEAFLAKAPEKVVSGLKKQASEASTLRQETLDAIEKLEQLA